MGRTPFPYSIVIVSMLALTGAHSWADQPGAYPVNPTMGSPGWYPQAAPYTGWQGDSRGPQARRCTSSIVCRASR